MLPREFTKRFWIASFYLIVANAFVITLVTMAEPFLAWLWYVIGFIVIAVPYAYYLRFASRVLGLGALKRENPKRYLRVVTVYYLVFVVIAAVLTLLFLAFSSPTIKTLVVEAFSRS